VKGVPRAAESATTAASFLGVFCKKEKSISGGGHVDVIATACSRVLNHPAQLVHNVLLCVIGRALAFDDHLLSALA